jgi:hypothetical protein
MHSWGTVARVWGPPRFILADGRTRSAYSPARISPPGEERAAHPLGITGFRGSNDPRRYPPSHVTFWRFAIQSKKCSRPTYATVFTQPFMRLSGSDHAEIRTKESFRVDHGLLPR